MPNAANLTVPGYVLIGVLIAIGASLMIASVVINRRVARSIESEQRHREKLYEYYRNTFSQLGVILIGIGVSLFIFFFQQNHLEERRRQAEIQQIMSRMAVRVSRVASIVRWLSEYDELLDDGGPYKNPEDGGNNHAVTATGPDLVKQVNAVQFVRRDVGLGEFALVRFSTDIENSQVVNEIDPHAWFVMIDDEQDLEYAVIQLAADFSDLDQVLGGDSVDVILASPEKHAAVKHEMLDILYDIDLLRDRSRRLLGRGCWFLSQGTGFMALEPIPSLDQRYTSHQEWLDEAKKYLGAFSAGTEDCYSILSPPEDT